MVAVTDYADLVSGRRVDKSGLFDRLYGEMNAVHTIHNPQSKIALNSWINGINTG